MDTRKTAIIAQGMSKEEITKKVAAYRDVEGLSEEEALDRLYEEVYDWTDWADCASYLYDY